MKKILLVICLLSLFICLLILKGCSILSNQTNKELTKRAVEYFSSKYDINKKDIVIERNSLYKDKNERICIDYCENILEINYNKKGYKIEYDEKRDVFTDNYQYEEVHQDFVNYLKSKFQDKSDYLFISSLDSSILNKPLKYTNDIKTYITNINKHDESETYQVRTNVDIRVKVSDEKNAKELYNKYYLEFINEFESLNINYSVMFAENVNFGHQIYYYINATDNSLYITNKVDNKKLTCKRGTFDINNCH